MRSPGDIAYNFHWIVPGEAARSSQAYAGFLSGFLTAHGIRAMVNLRGPNPHWRWWQYEKRICANLGAEHRDVMMSSKNLPTRAMLIALLDAFDSVARPFLMKCSGGQDRTSFAAALFIIHARGWNAMRDAQAQFAGWPYLHWPRQNQRWLRLFLQYAQEDSAGRPLRQWTASEYSPRQFKTWLEEHGHFDVFHDFHYEPSQTVG